MAWPWAPTSIRASISTASIALELAKPFGQHGQKVEQLGELKGAIESSLKANKDGKTAILNVCLTH